MGSQIEKCFFSTQSKTKRNWGLISITSIKWNPIKNYFPLWVKWCKFIHHNSTPIASLAMIRQAQLFSQCHCVFLFIYAKQLPHYCAIMPKFQGRRDISLGNAGMGGFPLQLACGSCSPSCGSRHSSGDYVDGVGRGVNMNCL